MVEATEATRTGLVKMTWLVLGGNGQLGNALCLVLSQNGIEHQSWGFEDLDIRSTLRCNQLISALAPTVIINAAAWTDVDGAETNPTGAYLVNVFGAQNLAVAAKSVGAVFAHISTDYVFSGQSIRPWGEDELRSPISVYGATKAAGEIAVLNEFGESSYIFRTAWLYSQWGKNFVKTMVYRAIGSNDQVKVVNDQIGQPTFALDLANQIVNSILAGIPFGIYHATNSGQASWFELAREVFDSCGVPISRVEPVSSNEFVHLASRPIYSVLGHGKWEHIPDSQNRKVEAMRSWKFAIREAIPKIMSTVVNERY